MLSLVLKKIMLVGLIAWLACYSIEENNIKIQKNQELTVSFEQQNIQIAEKEEIAVVETKASSLVSRMSTREFASRGATADRTTLEALIEYNEEQEKIRQEQEELEIKKQIRQQEIQSVIAEYEIKYEKLSRREQLVLNHLVKISYQYAEEYKIRPSILVAQAIAEGGWANWQAHYELWELGENQPKTSTEGWASGFGQKKKSGYVNIYDEDMIKKYCENITGRIYTRAAAKISNYDEYLDTLSAIYNPHYKEGYLKKLKFIIRYYDLKELDNLYQY